MKIDSDLHIHSYLSACSHEKETRTPAAIVSLAEEMGLRMIGFADHLWTNPHVAPSDWYRPQDESQISKLRSELQGISSDVRVLVGCEVETIAPGKFGITREFAEQLDFVLLACSHFHQKEFVEQPDGDTPQDLGKHIMKFFRSAVSSGLATSIPHPLIPCGSLDKFDEAIASISDAELQDAFGLAQQHGVALEITVGFIPTEKRRISFETPIRFLSLAKQAGCKFTLGTDAHSFGQQRRLQELRPLVDALQLTDDDLWSAE